MLPSYFSLYSDVCMDCVRLCVRESVIVADERHLASRSIWLLGMEMTMSARGDLFGCEWHGFC